MTNTHNYDASDEIFDNYSRIYHTKNASRWESLKTRYLYKKKEETDTIHDIQWAIDTMGLMGTETYDEIKKKYHRLLLKFHPDKNLNDHNGECIEKTKNINAAYSLIKKKFNG